MMPITKLTMAADKTQIMRPIQAYIIVSLAFLSLPASPAEVM